MTTEKALRCERTQKLSRPHAYDEGTRSRHTAHPVLLRSCTRATIIRCACSTAVSGDLTGTLADAGCAPSYLSSFIEPDFRRLHTAQSPSSKAATRRDLESWPIAYRILEGQPSGGDTRICSHVIMPVEEGKCRRANLLKRKASSDFAALSGPARPETAADRVP